MRGSVFTSRTGACVVIGIALAACAGSSDAGFSKEDYIEAGDAICREGEEDSEAFAAPPSDAPATIHEMFLDDVLTVVGPSRDEFQSLPAPEGDEAAKEKFDRYWDRVVSHVERARDAAAAGDMDEYEQILGELQSDDSIAADFKDYGFEVCGNT